MPSNLPAPRPRAVSGPRRAFKLVALAILLALVLPRYRRLNGVLNEFDETQATTTGWDMDAPHYPNAGNNTESRQSPADDDGNDNGDDNGNDSDGNGDDNGNGNGDGEDDSDFERILWPQLQKKLCPDGLPRMGLGPRLLRLARTEMGLPYSLEPERMKWMAVYYFGGIFDDAHLVVDPHDPSASVLYFSIWKCANNEIAHYLKVHFGEFKRSNETAYKKLFPSLHLFENRKNTSVFQYKGVSHNNPCVFTAIRDPISHFLSGYNEIEYRIRTNMYPHITNKKQKLPSFIEVLPRKDRFEAFVRGMLDEEPFLRVGFGIPHALPMSKILRQLKQRNLLPGTGTHWILPTLTNLTETLPPFLVERCPTLFSNYRPRNQKEERELTLTPSGLPPLRTYKNYHNSSNDPYGTYQTAKRVWKEGGHVARALCYFVAFDYACFYGDNVPTGTTLTARSIPETCQEVYQSDTFRKEILAGS